MFLKYPYIDEKELIHIVNNLKDLFIDKPDEIYEGQFDCDYIERYMENSFINKDHSYYSDIIYGKDKVKDIIGTILIEEVNNRIYNMLFNSEKIIFIKK